MINLREFQRKPERLPDYILWAGMTHPGVIQNKDGSYQVSFRYRGPDLSSAVDYELVAISERLNNTLRRLSSGWAIYSEAQRVKSKGYNKSTFFPSAVTQLIEDEREAYFSRGNHYESHYYFTLVYLPPSDTASKMESLLIEGDKRQQTSREEHFKYFLDEADKIFAALAEIFPETEPLTEQEQLTYLHSTISPYRYPTAVPDEPMYLDAFLYDAPLHGGWYPKLDEHHLRVVSVLSYPAETIPGLFDELNELDFEYRWVTRFLALDKEEAIQETSRYRRMWNSKKKTISGMIKEIFTGVESLHEDAAAAAKTNDTEAALYEINTDIANYGYFTSCLVILDEDEKEVEKKAKRVRTLINNLGFAAIIERLNCVDAWFGSIPGMCYSNKRRPLLSTINLSHLLPISAIWAGPEKNDHLNGPTLLYTETRGNTPFRYSSHYTDLGHTLVVGPPGTGKSALLALMAAQSQKYKGARVFYFDKGGSCRVLTLGAKGQFYDLGAEAGALALQPFARIEDETERMWAAGWVHDYLVTIRFAVQPGDKDKIWQALCSLASFPAARRNITGFKFLMDSLDDRISTAIKPLTEEGPFGRLFDAQTDNFSGSKWQAFEMETLMNTKEAVAPALLYLFHRIEQIIYQDPSVPTFIFCDESWKFFDDAIFAGIIREWLKVLRKANGSVIFATQSLQDIVESPIASAIKESCPNKIFLPNPSALGATEVYAGFGLNEQEIGMIAAATPKRQYYYKSPMGSRMFELALGPLALAYCAATSKEDQLQAQALYQQHGSAGFNEAWLTYKKLPEVVNKLKQGGG